MLRRALPPLLLALLAACALPGTGAEREWTWVWILTGPRDGEVQGTARAAAFTGHFANMDRLADEGSLLLAGPFGEPRAQADHRGVFVLSAADPEEARRIAATDPTARAGVFVFEVEAFRTRDPLERIAGMHEAAVAASGEPDPPPGFHARPYVLVSGRPAAAAARALDPRADGVLFSGILASGAEETALYCLDAVAAEEAWERLRALPHDDVEWRVMPWFASEEVARLRDAAR